MGDREFVVVVVVVVVVFFRLVMGKLSTSFHEDI